MAASKLPAPAESLDRVAASHGRTILQARRGSRIGPGSSSPREVDGALGSAGAATSVSRPRRSHAEALRPGRLPAILVPGKAPGGEAAPQGVSGRSRIRLVLSELLGLALSLLVKRIRRASAAEVADRVARTATVLGGLWSILARHLAIVRSGLPEGFCSRLLEIHDAARPVPGSEVRAFLAAELGRDLEDVFEVFESEPIASGSLAQVHRGFLKEEQIWVAIKVKRPSADEDFRADLQVFQWVGALLKRMTGLPAVTWEEVSWDLKRSTRERLDLRIEAAYMKRSRKKLRRHRVIVPKVFEAYSRRGLLVKEWVEGVSLHQYLSVRALHPDVARAWEQENLVDTEAVSRSLYLSMMRQVFEEELFHTAWHTHNTLLLRDNWVAIVDFWAMSSVDAEFRTKYAMLHQAILGQEYRKAVDLLLLLGTPVPATLDRDVLRNEILQVLRLHDIRSRARSIPYQERSLCFANGEIERILSRAGAPPTLSFMKIDAAFRVLDRSIGQLEPDVRLFPLAKRYWRDNRRRAIRRTLSREALRRSVGDLLSLATQAPDLLNEMLFFLGERVRQQARTFQKTSSKVAQMLAVTYGIMWKMWALTSLAFGLAVLEHRAPGLVASLGTPGREILSIVPRLSEMANWLVALVSAYLAYGSRGLARRFAERDMSDPNLTRI